MCIFASARQKGWNNYLLKFINSAEVYILMPLLGLTMLFTQIQAETSMAMACNNNIIWISGDCDAHGAYILCNGK